ncbi:MAG: Jag N-terminal domain-containing protein [Bacillales bacterium]|nr:Jag N-terminal domain-containing protein [Bacillales bacterium]MDY6003070.1 RNA-binding cell elongation regulator Jag/EloR [Bacilli bacterium]
MKTYTAKTVEDAIKLATEELGIEEIDLVFQIIEEKNGLFSKKATIQVYELSDAIEYANQYIKDVIQSLGISDVEAKSSLEDDVIRIEINTNHNPILIGKNGVTLQALNEIVRLAVSSKFKRRYRILLDVGEYKDKKYSHIASIARKAAKEVQKTKIDVTLNPMPSDERRIVHNALSRFSHIRTESFGEGRNRAVTIKYSEEE